MKHIIESGIKNSMPYKAYRNLVEDLAKRGENSGRDKSAELVNFTKLNDRRMKRWDKTLKVSVASKKRLSRFKTKTIWLVIAESWCSDGANILPVLNKIAELNPYIKLRVILRDENLELMEVLGTYGPRPSEAQGYVTRFRALNGTLTKSFKEDLQHWYNNNKGQNIIEDITELLNELDSANVYQ